MSNPTTWLNPEFWANVLRDTVSWAIAAAPRVLMVCILAWVLFKVLKVSLAKIAARATAKGDADTEHAMREHEKRVQTLVGIAQKTGQVSIWCFVIMLLLMQVGLNVAPLIAGAGIAGLAVGFGAQELVRDVITGFFMLLENQVRVGDVAIVNGTGGLVEHISLRTVVLRDLSGVVHVFQNGKISTLSNMTKDWSAMVFEIGVAYKENTDRVTRVMQEVADELQRDEAFSSKILEPMEIFGIESFDDLQRDEAFSSKILEPMEIFGIESFDDSAVTIKARLKTRPIEQWTVGREYRRRLKFAFDAQNIEIPFPHRTLYWGEASPPFKVQSGNLLQNGESAAGAPRKPASSPS